MVDGMVGLVRSCGSGEILWVWWASWALCVCWSYEPSGSSGLRVSFRARGFVCPVGLMGPVGTVVKDFKYEKSPIRTAGVLMINLDNRSCLPVCSNDFIRTAIYLES